MSPVPAQTPADASTLLAAIQGHSGWNRLTPLQRTRLESLVRTAEDPTAGILTTESLKATAKKVGLGNWNQVARTLKAALDAGLVTSIRCTQEGAGGNRIQAPSVWIAITDKRSDNRADVTPMTGAITGAMTGSDDRPVAGIPVSSSGPAGVVHGALRAPRRRSGLIPGSSGSTNSSTTTPTSRQSLTRSARRAESARRSRTSSSAGPSRSGHPSWPRLTSRFFAAPSPRTQPASSPSWTT
jgi:hypothetical protein